MSIQICKSFFLLLNTKKYILKNVELMVATDFHSIFFHTVNCGYQHSSKYLLLCSTELIRFETNWGWVTDKSIVIFGWTIPLKTAYVRTRLKREKLFPSFRRCQNWSCSLSTSHVPTWLLAGFSAQIDKDWWARWIEMLRYESSSNE